MELGIGNVEGGRWNAEFGMGNGYWLLDSRC
jgi:hypothetical protein